MFRMPTTAALLLWIALGGCATKPIEQPPIKTSVSAAKATVTDSNFDSFVSIVGSKNSLGVFYSIPAKEWYLTSLVDKKSLAVSHALHFSDNYSGQSWRFWDGASTNNAEQLPVLQLSRDAFACSGVNGGRCSYSESIAAKLTHETLAHASSATPLQIRITGRNTQPFFLTLDPEQIRVQLAETQRTVTELAVTGSVATTAVLERSNGPEPLVSTPTRTNASLALLELHPNAAFDQREGHRVPVFFHGSTLPKTALHAEVVCAWVELEKGQEKVSALYFDSPKTKAGVLVVNTQASDAGCSPKGDKAITKAGAKALRDLLDAHDVMTKKMVRRIFGG